MGISSLNREVLRGWPFKSYDLVTDASPESVANGYSGHDFLTGANGSKGLVGEVMNIGIFMLWITESRDRRKL